MEKTKVVSNQYHQALQIIISKISNLFHIMALRLANCSTDHFLLAETGVITWFWNYYSRLGGLLGIASQQIGIFFYFINAHVIWLLNKKQPFLHSSNSTL